MSAQPVNQQQVDEAAFAVVHNKSFPGFKALNQRALYDELMPDPVHVFRMTGVRITYNSISPCSFKSCTRRWVDANDPSAACSRDAAAACCKRGDGKTAAGNPSCGAVQPAEGARAATRKRVTTLDVTEFRNPPVESGPSAARDEPTAADAANDGAGRSPAAVPGVCDARPRPDREPEGAATGSNDSGSGPRTGGICGGPPSPPPRDRSSDDTTNYDWTTFLVDESKEDRKWEPDFNSTRKDPPKGSGNDRSRKDDRPAGPSAGQSQREAAVDRSRSRRSRGRAAAANSWSAALGRGPRKEIRTAVSPIRESDETDERPRERRATASDNRSQNSRWSNEVDFAESRKSGRDGRPVHRRDVIGNDSDDGRGCYIEDVSMPHMSFDSREEPWSVGFPECESRDRIEDVSMPRMDYESSVSSDGCESYEGSENADTQ